jgi:cation transport ATPase
MENNNTVWRRQRALGSTSTSSTSGQNYEDVVSQVQQNIKKFSLYDEIINALTENLTQRTKEIEELKNNYKKLEADAKKTYIEFKQETQTDKSKLIEVVGIFVAIFTFISIEVQILESINGVLRISGFTVLLFALLMLFLFLLNYMADNWINKDKNFLPSLKHPFYKYILGIIILSLVLIGIGDYKNPAEIRNNKEYIELKEQVELLEVEKGELEERINAVEEENLGLNDKVIEIQKLNNQE